MLITSSTRIILMSSIGLFLSMLDTGIMSLAMRDFGTSLHADANLTPLVLTSYTLFLCSTLLLFGMLAARYGSLSVFRIGMALFLLTSMLCGMATTLTSLLVFRSLQGVAAAMLQATAMALIGQSVAAADRAKVIATVLTIASMGPVLAPALGGLLLEHASWPWLFFINIPLGGVALLASGHLPSQPRIPSLHRIRNMVAYTLCIVLFFIGILLDDARWCLGLAVFCLGLSVYLDYQSPHRGLFINPNILGYPFYLALLLFAILGGTTACMFIIPPLKLLATHSLLTVSYTSMVLPILTVVTAKISPTFIQRWGHQSISILGVALMITSTLGLVNTTLTLATALICLATFGIGCGLLQPAATLLLLDSTHQHYHPIASALSRLCVNFGLTLASAWISFFSILSAT
jgi:MFS family permease